MLRWSRSRRLPATQRPIPFKPLLTKGRAGGLDNAIEFRLSGQRHNEPSRCPSRNPMLADRHNRSNRWRNNSQSDRSTATHTGIQVDGRQRETCPATQIRLATVGAI